jgi:hypothetical protein
MSPNGTSTRSNTNHAVLGAVAVVAGLAMFFVTLMLTGCSTSGTVKAAPAVATAPAHAYSKVTFVVTGGGSDVDYGTTNDNRHATGPVTRKMALNDNHGFTITAMLKHAGHVTCKILIGGKVVSSNHGSDTAICAVTRDPGTGNWFSLSS